MSLGITISNDCKRTVFFVVLVFLACVSTLSAQTLRERMELLNPASVQDTATRVPKQTGKRYAILCTQTHSLDYLTGLPKEDRLYPILYCSLKFMNDICRELGSFDGGFFVLGGINLTRENVFGVFKGLAEATKPDDEIFIYWQGHGGTGLPNTDGTEPDGYDEYLYLYETDNSSHEATRKTSITDDDFGHLIALLEGRRIMLVIEACHAGGMLESEKAGSANTMGMKTFQSEPFTSETWEELKRNPFPNSKTPDFRTLTGIRSDLKRQSETAQPATLRDALMGINAKSDAKGLRMTRFLTKSFDHAKDISRNQPKLAAIFTCKKDQVSTAVAYEDEEKGIILSPVALAFLLTVAKDPADMEKSVFFSEFCDFAKEVIKKLMERREDDVQTPVLVDTLGPAYLRLPQNP